MNEIESYLREQGIRNISSSKEKDTLMRIIISYEDGTEKKFELESDELDDYLQINDPIEKTKYLLKKSKNL
jgi:hypothetical protein